MEQLLQVWVKVDESIVIESRCRSELITIKREPETFLEESEEILPKLPKLTWIRWLVPLIDVNMMFLKSTSEPWFRLNGLEEDVLQ
jgi:hypothetical protein